MITHTSLSFIKTFISISILTFVFAGAILLSAPQAQAFGQCALPITVGLAYGSRDAVTGNQVSALQRFLAQDASIYPEGEITGFFGPATQRAVQRFQARYGVVSSGTPSTTGYGSVGALTRSMIDRLCDTGTPDEDEDEEDESDIDTIDEIVVYINKDTKRADVAVVINGGADLSFALTYSSKARAITFIGEKLETTYDFDFSEFSSDRKRNDALKRLIEWEYEEEDEDEDTLTLDDIRKITVTENAEGEYVDVVVDLKDGTDPEFDVVAERESRVVTAIAEKLENSYEFDFDDYRSDRTRDRDLQKLITWIEYDGDSDSDLDITGTTYGGCAMGPNGCPQFTLQGKQYTYTAGNIMNCLALTCPRTGTQSGTISTALYTELLEELTPSVLSANAKSVGKSATACRSFTDGADYVYTVEKDGVTYTLDTCKTQLASNTALQETFKDIWKEVQEGDTPDPKTFSVSMSPRTGLVQGSSITLQWPTTPVASTDGMYVVLRDSEGAAIASKRVTDPRSGTYTYTLPKATDYCNNFFSDALGPCGDYTKGKSGVRSFAIEVTTFTPANACFGFCAPSSASARLKETAKTAPFTIGQSGEKDTYTISDVKSVVTKAVDPIPAAIDDEYTLYSITLKNGTIKEVKGCGFCTREMFEKAFTNSGYKGDVEDLLDLAVADATPTSYSLTDVQRITKILTDPTPPTTSSRGTVTNTVDDEYTLYTITLNNKKVHTVKVPGYTTFSNVERLFKATGYTGDVRKLMSKAVDMGPIVGNTDEDDEEVTPFSSTDIKKVTSLWYNPVPSTTTDDYALYTITLKDGSVRTAKVFFGTSGGVSQYFEAIGYDGSPWSITNMASISVGR